MDTDIKELLVNLIEQADTSENTDFYYIRSWHEYRELRKAYKYNKMITKFLQASAKVIFKNYCKEVSACLGQFNKLLVFNAMMKAANFYSKETSILAGMIDEYENYLLAGNFLDFILGSQRPFDKMWDHRSI